MKLREAGWSPRAKLLALGVAAGLFVLSGYALVRPNLSVITGLVERISSTNSGFAPGQFLLVYFLACVGSTAVCLPVAALIVAVGGGWFGLTGFPVALLGITIGSLVPFFVSRKFAGPALSKLDSRLVERCRAGFARNQLEFVVLLRLLPWAPFAITTIIAGALQTSIRTFVFGTAIGLIPSGLALNAIGHGLSRLPDLRNLSAIDLIRDRDFILALIAIVGLGALNFLRRRLHAA